MTTYWFKRHLGENSPLVVCSCFEELYSKLGAPKDMMMIRTPGSRNITIFIGLPEPDLLNNFDGFKAAKFEEIPPDFASEIGNELDLSELRRAINANKTRLGQAGAEPKKPPVGGEVE
jgi:hypothetical protein